MAEQLPAGGEPVPDRPAMSADYGISGASVDTGRFPWHWVHQQLLSARNYWVGTTRPDGRPHAMPVWGLWLDDALYFATGRRSRKARNLAENPQIVVHLESGDDVVILEGTVEEVQDDALLARFVDAYEAKYQIRPDPHGPDQVTYALRPLVAFSWQESSFVESATRWRFGEG